MQHIYAALLARSSRVAREASFLYFLVSYTTLGRRARPFTIDYSAYISPLHRLVRLDTFAASRSHRRRQTTHCGLLS